MNKYPRAHTNKNKLWINLINRGEELAVTHNRIPINKCKMKEGNKELPLSKQHSNKCCRQAPP